VKLPQLWKKTGCESCCKFGKPLNYMAAVSERISSPTNSLMGLNQIGLLNGSDTEKDFVTSAVMTPFNLFCLCC
jgi:hypothetical protein